MLIFSCQRNTNIGYNILPTDDLLITNITDTISIEVHTIKTDSIITGGVSQFLLGEYEDPIFGYSKASFVLQFSMAQYINFKDTDIVDSVILTLPYDQDNNNIYGNTSVNQTIKIYKINKDLDVSTNYYADEDTSDFTGELIADTIYTPDATDSLLNIKLYNSFGDFFIQADESNYESTQSFHNFFNGLYIKAEGENNDGAIVKYDLNDDLLLTVYFHKNDAENTSYIYKVKANDIQNARFNLFEHDYAAANFVGTFDDETLPQDSVAYLQSAGGLYTRIKFPFLSNFQDSGKIVINRAELIINTLSPNISCENDFPAINKTYITGYISDNSSLLIPDYITESNYLGEIYSDGTYKFDIASYIQNIINGTTENNGINFYPASDASNISRTVITTGNNSNPMKLVITYSKL